MTRLPRVVIAAPGSGQGKTTVATGLMAALRARGLAVSGHKIGPDYIDPGYHALATGRPGRNLDPHLQGESLVVPLLLHGAATPTPADVAVLEGVMGLHDGAIGRAGFASTAHVARLTRAPVLLVVDVSGASRSVAAVVQGFATFDPAVEIAGVILNKVGSATHEAEIREAVAGTGVPVLGALRRDAALATPSRHLGLVPAAERLEPARRMVRALGERVGAGVDLDAVLAAARRAPELRGDEWDPAAAIGGTPVGPAGGSAVVAVGSGPAFTFRYAETDDLLAAAGLTVVPVDPLRDETLPVRCAGLYLGGGFPQVHAAELSGNTPLRHAIAAAARRGVPVIAECAGLLYLCRELDGAPMVGAIDAAARMTDRLVLGYREATALTSSVVAEPAARVTGHEFHRTRVEPGHGARPAWRFRPRPSVPHGVRNSVGEGFTAGPAGSLHASYLHVHWAGHPWIAARFAAAARAEAARAEAARAEAARAEADSPAAAR